MTNILYRFAWYLCTVIFAMWFIPFNLSFFTINELMRIWPFFLTFFEVVVLLSLGFHAPEGVAIFLRSYAMMIAEYNKDENNEH
jgi:hypothetical protein